MWIILFNINIIMSQSDIPSSQGSQGSGDTLSPLSFEQQQPQPIVSE